MSRGNLGLRSVKKGKEKKFGEMKNRIVTDRTLALIMSIALPFLVDQLCQVFPDNFHCKTLRPWIEFPEPPKIDYQISFSSSPFSTVTASGTSIYYNSTTTT